MTFVASFTSYCAGPGALETIFLKEYRSNLGYVSPPFRPFPISALVNEIFGEY